MSSDLTRPRSRGAEGIPFRYDDQRRGVLATAIGIAAIIQLVEIVTRLVHTSGSKTLTLAPAS